jgi:hypothetical protein
MAERLRRRGRDRDGWGSFLLLFARPSDAARFALGLRHRNRQFGAEAGVKLEDRIGVHAGEVFVQDQAGEAKLFGSQVDVCGRVVNLAQGGQILMTRFVFDNARAVLCGTDVETVSGLSWVSHGPYALKGIEEPVEVCEVGEPGRNPLTAPKTTQKARRVDPGEGEAVLGWRPAVGQEVPGTKWVLEEKLGEGGFGEVWVGRHQTLQERHLPKAGQADLRGIEWRYLWHEAGNTETCLAPTTPPWPCPATAGASSFSCLRRGRWRCRPGTLRPGSAGNFRAEEPFATAWRSMPTGPWPPSVRWR